MNDNDLEKRLSGLTLARQSDDYRDKGLRAIRHGADTLPSLPSPPFWRRHLPLALSAALVVSVTANVFQLLNDQPPMNGTGAESLVQCNTPAVAAAVATEHPPAFEFSTQQRPLQPQGMC